MPWQFYAGVSVCALAVLGVAAWAGLQVLRLHEQQRVSRPPAATDDRATR